MEMTEIEVMKLMGRYNASEEETGLLLASLKNLKMWTGKQFITFNNCEKWCKYVCQAFKPAKELY